MLPVRALTLLSLWNEVLESSKDEDLTGFEVPLDLEEFVDLLEVEGVEGVEVGVRGNEGPTAP